MGLDHVRSDIAMLRTPDGHGRLELTKSHTPTAVKAEPQNAPANTLGIQGIMFAVFATDPWTKPGDPTGGGGRSTEP